MKVLVAGGRKVRRLSNSVASTSALGQRAGIEVLTLPNWPTIFNAGQTSRSNVAHFMADLVTEDTVWNSWKGQSPVIYNSDPVE